MTMARFKRLKPFYGFRALSAHFVTYTETDASHANALGGQKAIEKEEEDEKCRKGDLTSSFVCIAFLHKCDQSIKY